MVHLRRPNLESNILTLLVAIHLLLCNSRSTTNAIYVSYEKPRSYAVGERIPIHMNKLTSSDSLTSMDYTYIDLCSSSSDVGKAVPEGNSNSPWQGAISALHGDSLYLLPPALFELRMKQNLYCRPVCASNLNSDINNNRHYAQAIAQDMHYNFLVDGMPVAYRHETEHRIAIRYWGGIPVGRRGNDYHEEQQGGDDEFYYFDDELNDPRFSHSTPQDLFIYNHFSFEITYWPVPNTNQYRVVRTKIQPFSIDHNGKFDYSSSGALNMYDDTSASPQSCVSHNVRTDYTSLNATAPQQVILQLPNNSSGSGSSNNNNNNNQVLFTYDVVWIEYNSPVDPWSTRWNVFLQMDDEIPMQVEWFGFLVAILINVLLALALGTWLLRDLSYKPISVVLTSSRVVQESEHSDHGGDDSIEVEHQDEEIQEEQVQEMKLWPLSSRLFFPPRVCPVAFCMASGIGAQLLLCGLVYVILFRAGIINESMGANILTPAVILYTIFSFVGGLVTTRFYGLFHHGVKEMRARALQASLVVATFFPLLGLLVFHLTYDVLQPETAPDYHVVRSSLPLIGIWLLGIVPLTLLGGWMGCRISGPMHNFPVSEGTKGYQDLDLQENNHHNNNNGAEDEDDASSSHDNIGWCWKHSRIFVLFFVAGIPPVACSFVQYAYGVAGSVYVGYFSDSSFFAIFSFLLFCTCIALVAALFFYQQIRSQNYEWWWTSFVVGASSGFYVFLLSISWILYDAAIYGNIPGVSIASYIIWFAFGSLAVTFLAGFVSVCSCMLLTRSLYSFLMSRHGEARKGDDHSDDHAGDAETEFNDTSMESSETVLRTEASVGNRNSYNMQTLIDRN